MKPVKDSRLDRPYITHDEIHAPLFNVETVAQAQSGDKRAFSALYKSTCPQMRRVVQGILQTNEDVEDALQIGYAKAYRYLPRLKEPAAFYSWLKRTMENAARDVLADSRSHDRSFDLEEYRDELEAVLAEDNTDDNDLRMDIRSVVDRMEPEYWQVLVLHYYEGQRLSEIARSLDEPQSTVRSRFARAKLELLRRLRDKGITRTVYGGAILLFFMALKRSAARQWAKPSVRTATVSISLAAAGAVAAVTVFANLPDPIRMPESSLDGNYTDPVPTDSDPVTSAATDPSPPPSDASGAPSSPSMSSAPSLPTSPDSFVADYRPGMANTRMMGQASQFKYATYKFNRQDDWLYMSNETVYKAKLGTSGEFQPVYANPQNQYGFVDYNVVMGDWIYYLTGESIYRVRTDGTKREKILAGATSFCMADPDTVYLYRESNGENSSQYTLCRYTISDKKTTVLCQTEFDRNMTNGATRHMILYEGYILIPNAGAVFRLDGTRMDMDVRGGDKNDIFGFGILGSRLYFENSMAKLLYIDFSGDEPVLHEEDITGYSSVSYDFIDTANNRIALTISHSDEIRASVWMSPEGEVLSERPQALRRTHGNTIYQYLDEGWVCWSNEDFTVISCCRTDGSEYFEFAK